MGLLVPDLQGLAADGVEDGQEARLVGVLEPRPRLHTWARDVTQGIAALIP